MLREHHALWRGLFIACDLLVSVLAFLGAHAIDIHLLGGDGVPAGRPPLFAYGQAIPVLVLVLWVTNSYFKLYEPRRTSSFPEEMSAVVKSSFMALLLLMALFFFNGNLAWARPVVVVFGVLNPVALILFRTTMRTGLRVLRSRGYNQRRVMIVGTGRTAQELIHRLRRNPWTGIHLIGLVSRSPERVGNRIHGVRVIGSIDATLRVVAEHQIDHVYIALPSAERWILEELVESLSERFIAVSIVPDIGYYLAPRHLTDFDGLPVVSVWETRAQGFDAVIKRGLDVAVASAGLAACLPLFLVIAGAIKATSRGPVLYVQKRMGMDGKIFSILKFRTMRADAGETADWTQPGDKRCTRFGRLLRRTSLDELPQLFNVLAGQMSLVGPRPERPVLIEEFRKRFPHYMHRHQVKAGMTGWAQVNGWRGNTSLRKRLQYDLYYMRHWSIWFDLKILALTLLRGLVHRNAY